MYMARIRENLIKSFDSEKIYKFLHIPVQSGSNKVLNDMKRGHTVETFSDVVKKARERFADFTISTDIIVGFPSETPKDFEMTKKLLLETRPDVVNLSKYSARPGTEAAEWMQIDAAEVKKRSKEIFGLIKKIAIENNQKWIGWKGKVLFDEKTEGRIKGRNFAYKSIFVNEPVKIGQTQNVEITDITQHSLVGKIIT
jgi:threonylcarbamoyladenosine tRNA methylthiotransferase CDKAL1